MPSRARCCVAVLLACACRTQTFAPPDGTPDAGADAGASDGLQPLALDFAVTGCARYDNGAARCFGSPPLALAFSPVSSPSFTRFLWTFGDGTPDSMERAPVHSYALPGSYDVTLVGGGTAGTASSTQHVSVAALQAGAPCDVGAQCASGLACACGAGTGCAPSFARGLCTARCPQAGCGAGAVCADLGPDGRPATQAGDAGSGGGGNGGADARAAADADAAADASPGADAEAGADGGAPAAPSELRGTICLAACKQDIDCPTGLACRELPAGGGGSAAAGTRWTRACFPRVRGDVGDACRDPSGALADAACLTGACADLGALGACSASCGVGAPCPSGSACARLGDGRTLCLRACAGTGDCARDPLIGCQAPAGGGALGFTVEDGAAGESYCAPRPCTGAADCAPAGVCHDGHCARVE